MEGHDIERYLADYFHRQMLKHVSRPGNY